jgi:two-component system, NarL family, sensor histidine kinase UhpB
MGLLDSLKILLQDLVMLHQIKIEFHDMDIHEEDLNKKLQINILRIVQEQLNNILKHSKATHAKINLTMEANNIILRISDNGIGCDPLKEKKSVGMINMNSRAELYHGKVSVLSKPGDGYNLQVILPSDSMK